MSLTCTIAGVSVDIQSISRPDRIDQKTVCSITVIDNTGTAFYQRGQPIIITDSILGTIFTGHIHNPQMTLYYPNAQKHWTMDCIQVGDYLASKRTSNKVYNNQYSGTVVVDQMQRYGAAEGLRANAALRWDELQSDWAAGTLSGTVATTNAGDGYSGDGDLELALAGVAQTINFQTTADFSNGSLGNVTAANNTLAPTPTPAIKIQGTQSLPGAGNSYTYVKIWQGSQAVGTNSYFNYDLWIDPSCPEIKIGVDLVFTDGTTLRDNSVYNDGQNMAPHPNTDLTGLANVGQWYHRSFWLANLTAKTIGYVLVSIEGDKAGLYTGWIKNINLFYQSTTTVNFFTTTLQTAQQMQNNGYSAVTVSVVNTYLLSSAAMTTNPISISSVGILKSSYLSYRASVPAGTIVKMKYSLDNIIYYTTPNNAPLASLLPGQSLAGKSIYFSFQFLLDLTANPLASPEVFPVLNSVQVLLNPSYTATKSDVAFLCGSSADWTQTGTTFTNTVANGKTLNLTGYTNNFDSSFGSTTLYSGGTPGAAISNRQLALTVNTGFDARLKLNDPGQYQNFTAEIDINVSANVSNGICYRCTGFQNVNDTYAYSVTVSPTQLLLGRGTNTATGAGGFTSISAVTIALTSGNWHRLKIIVNGSSHQVFLDDIRFINVTDTTYSAAGYLAIRVYNSSGSNQTGQFDNFGVMPALSGTWVSPAISLAGAAAYGSSLLSYRDQRQDATNCTIKVESSLDGGTTWSTYTNASTSETSDPLQGLTSGQSLSGKSIQFRITLSTTTATLMPGIDNFRMLVAGAFSSSGTRVSPVLSLAPAGTAGSTLVSWNANTPAGTTVTVATSPDGTTWTNVSNGAAIPGITTQANPITDSFNTNTSANYTQYNLGGGTSAFTYDTTNSRITSSGSASNNNTVFRNDQVSFTDGYIEADLDQANNSGLACRISATNSMYILYLFDSAVGNGFYLYSVVNNTTYTQIATGTINFTRGTYHKFRLSCIGTTISVLMDGVTLTSVTDTSVPGSGKAGLLSNMLLRCYNIRIQPLGQSLAGKNVYTRITLASTDPTVTPQMLDMQTFVSSPDIGVGILIPSKSYLRTFLDADIADLNKQSDYWTNFRNDLSVIFQPRQATPAPFVLSSLNSQVIAGQVINDVLVDGAELDNSGDSYRNRQIMKGAIATNTFTEIKAGDGTTTSWALNNPVAAPPTVFTLNGQSVTFGVQGVDTGKEYYYQIGSTAITQDSSQSVLQVIDSLSITYLGSSSQDVVLDNTSMSGTITQSMMATIERAAGGSSSGIVEAVLDVSGTPTTVAAATAQGNQLLQRFGNIGRTFKCKTLRSGFAPGQQVSLFVPEFNLMDVQMLVVEVDVTLASAPGVTGGLLYSWQLTMMEGPNIGDWVQLFSNIINAL